MFRDANQVEITSASALLKPLDTFGAVILVDCKTDFELAAVFENDDTTVEAKFAAGVYQDIKATPLDLSPFAPNRTAVLLRITAASDADPATFVTEIVSRRS